MTTNLDRLTQALSDRYTIERELGAGGMATVYLAHDIKHDRPVALKVLRPELAAVIGAERFLAEIRTTANLQHPHILPLFDSGEADGFLYYVMPYIEGETLRDRLEREKQLPVADAMSLAKEIASALDYAHRHDIIHRDIKPENVLVHDGQALVADFGIALAASKAGGTRITETGMSLGTPHYMSPEQAMGDRELTACSDVYALGATLYEMLSGEPPFSGPTAQAIVAKVMTDDPRSLRELRRSVPPQVDAACLHALEKLPADRFASAAEFAAALEDPSYTGSMDRTLPREEPAAGWRRRAVVPLIGVTVVLAVVVGWLAMRPVPDPPVRRFALQLDTDQGLLYSGFGNAGRLSLTPDGAGMVYVGFDSAVIALTSNFASSAMSKGWKLWHRSFERLRAEPLPGTEGAWNPEVSPDGDRVVFLTSGDADRINVITLEGGPVVTAYQGHVAGRVTWGRDGWLYFFATGSPDLLRVPAEGGDPEKVVTLQPSEAGNHFWGATILPGAGGAVVLEGTDELFQFDGYRVHLVDLATGQVRQTIDAVDARYSPSGHLVLVMADGSLMAAPLDVKRLTLTGRPVALLQGVDIRQGGITDLSVSPAGLMAYTAAGFNAPEQIVWATPKGLTYAVDPNWVRETEFEAVELSPDSRRLAVQVSTTHEDVWIKQLDDGPLSRLTFAGDGNGFPTWTPDGTAVSYVTSGGGTSAVWTKRADGSGKPQKVVELDRPILIGVWSPDGKWLLLSVGGRNQADDILGFRPGIDTTPVPLVATAADEFEPAISGDGRWLAYVSNETGQREIYVRPFPNTDATRWQVSTTGGMEPRWGPQGRSLHFRSLDGQRILTMDLADGPGSPHLRSDLRLPTDKDYEVNPRNWLYDVAADGRYILIQRAEGGDVSGDLVLIEGAFTLFRHTAVR